MESSVTAQSDPKSSNLGIDKNIKNLILSTIQAMLFLHLQSGKHSTNESKAIASFVESDAELSIWLFSSRYMQLGFSRHILGFRKEILTSKKRWNVEKAYVWAYVKANVWALNQLHIRNQKSEISVAKSLNADPCNLTTTNTVFW